MGWNKKKAIADIVFQIYKKCVLVLFFPLKANKKVNVLKLFSQSDPEHQIKI
jgi:hypothetical protein